MRSARAFLASLGASTSLVLAGTLAMATLSTFVAFSGLPGVREANRQSPAAILAAAQPVTEAIDDTGTPVSLAVPRALSRRASVLQAQRARRRGAGGSATAAAGLQGTTGAGTGKKGDGNAGGGTIAVTAPTGKSPAAGQNAGADRPSSPSVSGTVKGTGKAVGDTVKGAGKAVADATKTTADGVGKAVAPVAPGVAGTVQQTGTVAADTVQGVTDTAGDAVKGVTGGG